MRYLKYIILFLLLSSVYSIGQVEYSWRIVNPPGGVQVTGADAFQNTSASPASFVAITWTVSGSLAGGCTIQVDNSTDGTNPAGQSIAAQTCTSNGSFISASATTPTWIRASYVLGSGGGSLFYTVRGCNNSTCTTGGGGGGPTSLSNITSLTSTPATLVNGNFVENWNYAITSDSQNGFNIGETSAALNGTLTNGLANQNILSLSTASNSTASPFNVQQGNITNTVATPFINLRSTWNNSSLVGMGALTNVICTAAAIASKEFDWQVGNSSQLNLQFSGANCTNPLLSMPAAGSVFSTGSVLAATFTGGSSTVNVGVGGTVSAGNSTAGGILARGNDDSNSGSSVVSGYGIFRAGINTNATPNAAAVEGPLQLGSGFLKGTAIANIGDTLCGTTTAYTVTDCPIDGTGNIIGIATAIANPLSLVTVGQSLVKTDNTAVLNDIICRGVTTAGLAHDNGSVACLPGATIGTVIAVAGTPVVMAGSTTAATAMSTTLPMVNLSLGGNIGVSQIAVPQTNSTAVTVGNPTAATDTIMMAISLPANYLNVVGQTYHIVAAGVLNTTAASVPQVTITPKICSVAGCGSGTVTPLAAIQSSALNTTAITNATWKEDIDLIVVANGASCNFIVKGAMLIDLGAAVTATPDTVFVDTNTAVSTPNQICTNTLFLDFFVQQSTTGASNSYKQLLGLIR